MNNPDKNIDSLLNEYGIILPDTSAILSNYYTHANPNALLKNYSFWKKNLLKLSNKSILFHKGIYQEIEFGSKMKSSKREFNKRANHGDFQFSERHFKRFASMTEFCYKRKKELLKAIQKKDLLLELNKCEEEHYNLFKEKYYSLLYEDFHGKSMGNVDFEFLICGLTLADCRCRLENRKLALVSNDRGIFEGWSLIRNDDSSFRNVDFYLKNDTNTFEKRYPRSNN